jgi:hypothetical protein
MSTTTALRTTPAPRVAAEIEPDDTRSVLSEILARTEQIAVQQSRPSPVHLKTWEEIERFAEKAARSGMVPKDYIDKADAICIAVQMGSELGLAPMQAIQNIACINGRPSIWGDAMPGLCRASGKMAYMREWSEGEGDNRIYYCEAKRKDDPNIVTGKFSVADAKKADLWKTTPTVTKHGRNGSYEVASGPWYSYPERMLQNRARGFCLRDAFPDVLKGLISAEEAADIPFEDTGLKVPPPPPPTTAAAPPAPASTPATKPSNGNGHGSSVEIDPDTRRWLDNLRKKLATTNRAVVDKIAQLPSVVNATAHAPDAVKNELSELLADAYAACDKAAEDAAEAAEAARWADTSSEIENAPEHDAAAPDTLAQQVAECNQKTDDAPTLRELEKHERSNVFTALLVMCDKAKRPDLAASMTKAADARREILRAGA